MRSILQEYRQFSLAAQYKKEPCMALVYPDGEVLFIPPVDIKVKTKTKTKTKNKDIKVKTKTKKLKMLKNSISSGPLC